MLRRPFAQCDQSQAKLTIADIIDRCNGNTSKPFKDMVREVQRAAGGCQKEEIAPSSFSKFRLFCADPTAAGSVEPTSPRSVDACLRLGIEPYELKFIPKEQFHKNLEDTDLAELAFKHHEGIRQVTSRPI